MKPGPFGLPTLKWGSIDKTKGEYQSCWKSTFSDLEEYFEHNLRGVDILIVNLSQLFSRKGFFQYLNQRNKWILISEMLFRKKKVTNWPICGKIGMKTQSLSSPHKREPESNACASQCFLFPGDGALPPWWLQSSQRQLAVKDALSNAKRDPLTITVEQKSLWNIP